MKIKVRPYPNFKISEEVFQRDVVAHTSKSNSEKIFSDRGVMIVEYKEGERRLVTEMPIEHNDNVYISVFPNLVHVFLNTALQNYSHSEKIKTESFTKCGKKSSHDVYLLDADVDGTHECYNNYIGHRTVAIVMLISALEAYLNQTIPNDFVYKKNSKEYRKGDIEGVKISFPDKIALVVPQWLGNSDFWKENESIKRTILELNEHRRNIIHLKTDSLDDIKRYDSIIDQVIKFNILNAIESVTAFMNLATPNFVESDDFNFR